MWVQRFKPTGAPAGIAATPLILAVQNGHFAVVEAIVNSKNFSSEQLKTEFNLASKYGQSDLAGRLLELGEIIRMKNGDPVPHCTQDESVSLLDLKAQGHKAFGNICAICQGIPGSEGIDGLQTKDSVMTQCCLQPYCLSCLKGTKGKCPSCRSDWDESKLTAVSGALCGFKWDEKTGRDYKIPVPRKASAAVVGLQPFREFNRVPVGMTQIGDRNNMYRVGNLVWSDRAREDKDYQSALDYCLAQGGRLPTQAELDALRRAMGYPDRYDHHSIPNMRGNFFWASDEAPPARAGGPRRAFGLVGYDGSILDDDRGSRYNSVRCVVEAAALANQGGHTGHNDNHAPAPGVPAAPAAQANRIEPIAPQLQQQGNRAPVGAQGNAAAAAPAAPAGLQPFREFNRVPVGMTQIGDRNNMYRLGNLVWSDRAPADKTHHAALDYCVAQGGRLPTRAELEALRRALGYPDRYDRNRIPNMAGNFFWASDEAPPARAGGPRRAFGLSGSLGHIDYFGRVYHNSVRCVVEVRE